MAEPPFSLPDPARPTAAAEARQALGAAAERIAGYLAGMAERPIFPASAQAPAGELIPERGESLNALFGDAADWAEKNAIHVGNPGYAGHMDSGVSVAGLLGDWLASALNQNLLAYELAPGATLLEKKLIDEFAVQAGFGPGAGGIFTTGGTVANLTALLIARDSSSRDASRLGLSGEHPLCVLASEDAHYSIGKACAVLGLGSDRVLPVPVTGPERRMDPAALPQVRAEAHRRGLRPIAVVATAGTTSCGAVDPIDACADFCEEHGLWLHVDGAHGGALIFHPGERARLLAGLQRADSFSFDPHKWMWAPKSAGVLLVRRSDDLVTAQYHAPYLDRFSDHGEALPVSQGRRALDGSRRFDALKVWMILRHMGRRGMAAAIESRLGLTRWLHQQLSEHPFFAPRHRPDLNVLAFAPRAQADEAHIEAVHRRLEQEGRFWSSYTVLEGRPCHRVVLLNPTTEASHLTGLVDRLHRLHEEAITGSQPPGGLLHSSPLGPQKRHQFPGSDPADSSPDHRPR
jgi:L-2,4-diaminobutyrate decarboxylase